MDTHQGSVREGSFGGRVPVLSSRKEASKDSFFSNQRTKLRVCSIPIQSQNISSCTHHIESLDACIEH
jgi:hypothetical protein